MSANFKFAPLLPVIAMGLLLVSTIDLVAVETHAIFKSIDRARSWKRADVGIPGDTRVNSFASLNNVLIAGTDQGVFVSSDDAGSWQRPLGDFASSARVTCLATAGQSLFAGTAGRGLWLSTVAGTSWSRIDTYTAKKTRCLLARDGRLYAGTDEHGVLISTDQRSHWESLGPGLPARAQVFDLELVAGKLFAGLYNRGLFVWNEQASEWDRSGDVVPLVLATSQLTLLAGQNPGGIHRSVDRGVNWLNVSDALQETRATLPANAPVWELAANETIALAGASTGIYYSEDHGRTWTRSTQGLPQQSPGVAFLITTESILAASVVGEYERK